MKKKKLGSKIKKTSPTHDEELFYPPSSWEGGYHHARCWKDELSDATYEEPPIRLIIGRGSLSEIQIQLIRRTCELDDSVVHPFCLMIIGDPTTGVYDLIQEDLQLKEHFRRKQELNQKAGLEKLPSPLKKGGKVGSPP